MPTIRKATVQSFDNATKTATIQIDGSLAVYLTAVPVNRILTAAEMVTGRTVAVAFFDDSNPEDCMVLAVH